MRRLCAGLGTALLGMAFLVSTGVSQDAKKDPGKAKGMLPPGWKKLNLTKEQVQDIYKIQANTRTKVKALEEQIEQVQAQEKQEMFKLLTKEQQEALRKLTTGEDSKVQKKEPDKDKVRKDKEKD